MIRRREFYPNGYGISIIQGGIAYTNGPHEFEVAVLTGTEQDWELCYNTPITSDVLGHLSDNDVDKIRERVKALPERKVEK
jgi:hypothetical protein